MFFTPNELLFPIFYVFKINQRLILKFNLTYEFHKFKNVVVISSSMKFPKNLDERYFILDKKRYSSFLGMALPHLHSIFLSFLYYKYGAVKTQNACTPKFLYCLKMQI